MSLIFCITFSETLLILKRAERDMIKKYTGVHVKYTGVHVKYTGVHVKYPSFLSAFNETCNF